MYVFLYDCMYVCMYVPKYLEKYRTYSVKTKRLGVSGFYFYDKSLIN